MTTTDPATASTPAHSDAAATLRETPLARLLVRHDGDAVAAAGVLARALRAVDVPVQVSPTATRAERSERATDGDPEATTVAIGPADGADLALAGDDRPVALAAVGIATELGVEPDAVLALAGVHAAGGVPTEATPELLESAASRGLERRPGVGLATADLADGLAHSTLFHAPFSGDPAAASEALAEAGVDPDGERTDERGRAVASLVAVAATGGPAPDRAATTVERALRPHAVDGPVPTVAGYGDVLDVLAATDPGLALGHAAGNAPVEPGIEAWQTAAAAAHEAIHDADPGRYDGVVAYDAGSASPALVARLARDTRCPEPVAVAIGEDVVGLASRRPDAPALGASIADALGGAFDASPRRAVVRGAASTDRVTVVETVRDGSTEGTP